MNDFLGQPLSPGDFVTYPGTGNRGAEYGMILHRVIKLTNKGVRTERLQIKYHWTSPTGERYDQARLEVHRTNSTIKKPSKLVRVTPPPGMVDVFENPEPHAELVGAWLHGQKAIDWDTLTVLWRYDGEIV